MVIVIKIFKIFKVEKIEKIEKCSVFHLVWAAPALLDQDPNHLIMVVISSLVNWQSTLIIRQHWISPCL